MYYSTGESLSKISNCSSISPLLSFFKKILGEGQYILPMCTIFGLEEEERGWLVQNQAKLKLENKFTDKDDEHEGIEVATSAYKVVLY